MANIKDIAKYCGVSAMTVSRVLNNSDHVSGETREKVLSACEALGYVPNQAAKSLIKKETGMIGLLVPDIGNYYADIIKKTTFYLDDRGYGVILCHCDNKKANERKYLQFLFQGRVDGIILFPIDAQRDDYSHLAQSVPVVMVNKKADGLAASFVGTDNYVGGTMMTEHMISKGYRRIGAICGELAQQSLADRYAAYKDTLRRHDIPFDPALALTGRELSFETGEDSAALLLERKADAIFAFNDVTAMGVIRYCNDRGIHIPEDIGLAGYDNIKQLEMYSLRLATMDYNASRVGITAADILLEEIADKSLPKRSIMFKPRLVEGNSL